MVPKEWSLRTILKHLNLFTSDKFSRSEVKVKGKKRHMRSDHKLSVPEDGRQDAWSPLIQVGNNRKKSDDAFNFEGKVKVTLKLGIEPHFSFILFVYLFPNVLKKMKLIRPVFVPGTCYDTRPNQGQGGQARVSLLAVISFIQVSQMIQPFSLCWGSK